MILSKKTEVTNAVSDSSKNSDAKLSAHDCTKLLHLARQGDIAGILGYIDQLMHENPDPSPLLQRIRQLAKNFEEEAICDLLELNVGKKMDE